MNVVNNKQDNDNERDNIIEAHTHTHPKELYWQKEEAEATQR